MRLYKYALILLICTTVCWGFNKKILAIDFTATSCPPCGVQADDYNEWIDEHHDDVIGIAVHSWGDLHFPESETITNTYPVTGIPAIWKDFEYTFYPSYIEDEIGTLGETSEVDVKFDFIWDETTRTISGDVILEWDEDTNYSSDLVIDVLLMQDSIPTSDFPQSVSSGDEPEFHRDAVIDAAFGGIGESHASLPSNPSAGDIVRIPFTIAFEDSYRGSSANKDITLDYSKMSIVAYLALSPEDGVGQVINAEVTKIIEGEDADPQPYLKKENFYITDEQGNTTSNIFNSQSGEVVFEYSNPGQLTATNLSMTIGNVEGIIFSGTPTNLDDLEAGADSEIRFSYQAADYIEAGTLNINVNMTADQDLNLDQDLALYANAYIWSYSDNLTTCNSIIVDAGETDNYLHDHDDTLRISPSIDGATLTVEVIDFATEIDYDYLEIDLNHNGEFENLNGATNDEQFTGDAIDIESFNSYSGNNLSMAFHSDNSINDRGFIIKISCTDIPVSSSSSEPIYSSSSSEPIYSSSSSEPIYSSSSSEPIYSSSSSEPIYSSSSSEPIYYSSSSENANFVIQDSGFNSSYNKASIKFNTNNNHLVIYGEYIGSIKVYSILGDNKLNAVKNDKQTTIDLTNLKNGTYILHLDNGQNLKLLKTQ